MTIESTGAMSGRMMCRSRWKPLAPSSCGRLEHLGAHLGEAGVDRQGDERHAHPDDDHRGDDEEGQRLGEPVVALGAVDAEPHERPVEQAAAPVDDPDPHRHRRDDGHRPGDEQGDLEHDAGQVTSAFISTAIAPPMATVTTAVTTQKTIDRTTTVHR